MRACEETNVSSIKHKGFDYAPPAIVRRELVEQIERRLQDMGVHGLSISRVKGYGEYANFYTKDWLIDHAHIGVSGDGIVALAPVDKVFRIRTQSEAAPDGI